MSEHQFRNLVVLSPQLVFAYMTYKAQSLVKELRTLIARESWGRAELFHFLSSPTLYFFILFLIFLDNQGAIADRSPPVCTIHGSLFPCRGVDVG